MAGQKGEDSRVLEKKNKNNGIALQEVFKVWQDKKVRTGLRVRK